MNRATRVPVRGCRLTAATGKAVEDVALIEPKPPVVFPLGANVLAAFALVLAGSFTKDRLNMLVNSIRRLKLARSLNRHVRPRFMFSDGRRCLR